MPSYRMIDVLTPPGSNAVVGTWPLQIEHDDNSMNTLEVLVFYGLEFVRIRDVPHVEFDKKGHRSGINLKCKENVKRSESSSERKKDILTAFSS